MAVLERNLVTPVPTRWNSLYDSLTCLLAFDKATLDRLCDELSLNRLTEMELNFLKEYQEALQALAMALDKLQGQNECYYGFVIPVLRQVEKQLMERLADSMTFTEPMVRAALAGLRKRFGPLLDQHPSQIDALLATVSHPQFKLKPIRRELRDDIKSQLLVEAELLSPKSPTAKPGKKTDNYFQFTDDEEDSDTDFSEKNKISIEVCQYLEDQRTSIDILHKYPAVKRVFIKYNTTIPSSAPVERLFSFASIILSGRRGLLSDDDFEMLTILKATKAFQ